MSMDTCKSCDRIVDTDDDPDCYYDADMNQTPCTCEWCREEKEGE